MAGGWSKDGSVQDQIDASINDAVANARRHLPNAQSGESLEHCEECEVDIPDARRKALPGVRRCVLCQEALDKEQKSAELFNRRGSKDSQLR